MSVLVTITTEEEAGPFIAWGCQFAVARGEDLTIICPIQDPVVQAPTQISLDENNENPLVEAARVRLREVDPKGQVLVARGPRAIKSVLKVIRELDASMVIVSKPEQKASKLEGGQPLATQLLARAPCDVVILRCEEGSGDTCNRILVPTSGGPHTECALKLANGLAEDDAGCVKALYVQQHEVEDATLIGERIITRVLARSGLATSTLIQPAVAMAPSVSDGIADAAHEQFDLILIGASNVGFMRRALFGTIPERLLKGPDKTAIAIIRRAPEFFTRTRDSLVRIIERYIPQLDREARVSLFEHLQAGSEADMDFITLISLSTAIASLGLIQNSGAVIIGAMLVAPLMTPMLGAGLGLVQGNVLLVRNASRSILLGFTLSLCIGLFMGLTTPALRDLTPEMLARCSPNILDLGIALLSGMAAAYALARPGLLAALPGVAIAAALVPPIATTGIALALGKSLRATGAAFLFSTNLVAIIFAAAITLFVLGVRPSGGQTQPRIWARRALVGLFITGLCFAVPLGISLVSDVTQREDPLRVSLERTLQDVPHTSLAAIKSTLEDNSEVVTIELYSRAPIPAEIGQRVANTAREHLEATIPIRIITLLEWRPAGSIPSAASTP